MSQISDRIKSLRNAKGLTQEQLAGRLHVTRQAVSSWETGKTQPDIETLGAIAAALGVSSQELIYGESKKKFYLLPKRGEEHPMFENIGQKIKKLASVLTWIGCVASFVVSFFAYPIGPITIFPLGCLLSWVGSFLLYGFGQLIENSDRCVELLTAIHGVPEEEKEQEPEPATLPKEPWTCYACGTENEGRVGCCIQCGTTRGWSAMKFQKEQSAEE